MHHHHPIIPIYHREKDVVECLQAHGRPDKNNHWPQSGVRMQPTVQAGSRTGVTDKAPKGQKKGRSLDFGLAAQLISVRNVLTSPVS